MMKTAAEKLAIVLIGTLFAAAGLMAVTGCGSSAEQSEWSSCPACGSGDVLPIVYGLPGPGLRQQAENGEVVLGGCVVSDDSPVWYCNHCGHRWGSFAEESDDDRSKPDRCSV